MPKPKSIGVDNRLLLAALVLVISAGVIINSVYVVNQINADGRHNASVVLNAQQTAVTGSLTASVKEISENDTIDPAFTLASTQIMLIMTLSITNNTKAVQDFIPTNDLYIRTREGDYRPLHPSLYIKKQIGSGKIKPGETFTGQISFGVPKTAAHPMLYIDTQWDNAVPVVFDVLKQN